MRSTGVMAAALLAFTASTGGALAKTCAETSVTAKGEQSRYAWLAKTKARANWRSKVRRTPGLGPKYARWDLAEASEERCATGAAGTLCTFSGTPCAR
jgi:hypothetical protein